MLTVFGHVVTSLSWFGVNVLGVGLHSYGFMGKLSGFSSHSPEPSQDRSKDFNASTGPFVPFTIIGPCFNRTGNRNITDELPAI